VDLVSWAPGWASSLRGGWARLTVELGPVGTPALVLEEAELSGPVVASGGSLRLRSWATSAAQLRVTVLGSPLRLAQVRAVYPGGTVAVYLETAAGRERVWCGRLREVLTQRPGAATLVVDGAEVWAQARHLATTWRTGLGAGVTGRGSNVGAWTLGDTSLEITSVVYSPAVALCPTPSGTSYLLMELDTAGGPALFSATGVSVTGLNYTLTGLKLLSYPSTTTPTYTPAGADIRWGPLVVGSPQDVVARVLASGGGGGAYDLLPAGTGLWQPAWLLDATDIGALSSAVGARGYSDAWTWGLLDTVTPEGAAILGWASALGLWLTQRQGSLTVRAAVDPHDAATWSALQVGDVTDAQLVAVGAHTTRAPDCIPEYSGVVLLGVLSYGLLTPIPALDPQLLTSRTGPRAQPAGADGGLDGGWPGGGDVPPLTTLSYVGGSSAAFSAHFDDVERRLGPWAARLCEAVEVTLTGDCLAWAAGDLVSVTSAAIPGPAADGGVAVGRRALWVPSEWDWTARTVAGTLYLLSAS
jgi:hypothetical protein